MVIMFATTQGRMVKWLRLLSGFLDFAVIRAYGRGLGPGLTCSSADAVFAVETICRPGPGFAAPAAAVLICLAWARGRGFTRSGGQLARAIPQPEKGMTVTHGR